MDHLSVCHHDPVVLLDSNTCQIMPILPSSSDDEIVRFAKAFLHEHLVRFRKDIKICLTPNRRDECAYFPALITCIAFLEF